MAPRIQTQVTVRDRVVAGGGQTVEQLFDDVRRRLGSSCDVTVTYEEQLGYPLSVYSDCGEEGDGWKVTDFAVLE